MFFCDGELRQGCESARGGFGDGKFRRCVELLKLMTSIRNVIENSRC